MPRMMAKVVEECKFHTITSCAGRTFLKGRWLYVPEGFEEEAADNPYLEVKEEEDLFDEPFSEDELDELEELIELEPEPEPEPDEEIIWYATDSAVEYADEHGIDLGSVTGTGKDGKITLTDVKDAEGA